MVVVISLVQEKKKIKQRRCLQYLLQKLKEAAVVQIPENG